jgi:hypothetical protein
LLGLYNSGLDREEWTALLARTRHNRRSGDSDAQNKCAITPQLKHYTKSTVRKLGSHDGENLFCYNVLGMKPIIVAAWSKASTVFSRSDTDIVGSNTFEAMNVCVRLVCVCVVLGAGSGLATG